jgi:hypothetical protein
MGFRVIEALIYSSGTGEGPLHRNPSRGRKDDASQAGKVGHFADFRAGRA